MTDAIAASAPARLYSQTEYDPQGNFHYQGDFYRPRESFQATADRVNQHLAAQFAEMRFAIRTESFRGGRKILAELVDCPDDLTERSAQDAFIVRVRDQMERFGFTRANPLQDFHSTAFFAEVRIATAYWAALAARRGPRNPVDTVLSLAAFKKRVRVGDRMTLKDAPAHHRALGTTRTITAVRSSDLIFDGKAYLTLPRASAFACDGRYVRIAMGHESDPDAHLLYEWHPQQA